MVSPILSVCFELGLPAEPDVLGVARDCNAGYYKSGSSCVLCPTGQWSGTAGVTACQTCTNGPANSYYLQRVPDTSTTTTNSCPWYAFLPSFFGEKS